MALINHWPGILGAEWNGLMQPARGAIGLEELMQYLEVARLAQLDNPWISRLPSGPINPIGKQAGWAGPGPTPGAATHREAYGLPVPPPAHFGAIPAPRPFEPSMQEAYFRRAGMRYPDPGGSLTPQTSLFGPPVEQPLDATAPGADVYGSEQSPGLINPMLLALLSAGAAGLQQSGWQPRKVTVGEGVGTGLQAGLGTYLQAQQMQERGEIAREELTDRRLVREATQQKLREDTEATARLNNLKKQYDEAVEAGDSARAQQLGKQILIEQARRSKDGFIKVGPGEVLYDPITQQQVFAGPAKESKDTAFEQRVEALQQSLEASGVKTDRAKLLAQGIAAGRYQVSVNPISGERQVIDVANPPRPIAYLPSPGVPGGPPVSGPQATGVGGFMSNVANRITDAFGMGLAYPEAEDAKNAMLGLRAQTITLLQEAVPGRPSVAMMEQLKPLTVSPGSILQADAAARSRLTDTRNIIAAEIRRMESDIFSNPGQFKPEQTTAARMNHSQLKNLLATYDQIIESFGSKRSRKELEEILLSE